MFSGMLGVVCLSVLVWVRCLLRCLRISVLRFWREIPWLWAYEEHSDELDERSEEGEGEWRARSRMKWEAS